MRKEIKVLILVLLIFQSTNAFIFDLLGAILDPFGIFRGGIGGGIGDGGGDMSQQQPQQQPQTKRTIRDTANIPLLAKLGRSMDGSGNNRNNPSFGRSFVSMPRLTKAAYADNKAGMINRGNPRELSNIIGAIHPNEQIKQNRMGLTMLFVLFGQFMDHDLDLTFPSFTQKALIKVPRGDPWFDKKKEGNKTIQFSRSKFVDRNGERVFLNELTSWIDGSQVYGSTADQNKPLREFKSGKLKLVNNMLPKDSTGAYMAGDVRVNQNIGLTSIQTVFARQHNRQCEIILTKFPHLNDEEVFQMARNKIVGFIQKIAFKEYLPLLLGQQAFAKFVGNYRGYDINVRPDINLQFSGAAYRIGHPLLFDQIDAYDYFNKKNKTFKMEQMFMSFQTLKKPEQVDFIINGLTRSPAKQRNNQIVDGLRNLLRQFPGFIQDLFALNIQRGRDHGLPDYNTVRSSLGLSKYRSFSQLSSNPQTVRRLNVAYNNNINMCDLWVGIISEQPVNGGNLGIVGSAIVGQTFRRVRDGDRFWYENAYPQEDINEIQSTTFRDIIIRNTKLSNLPSGFILPNFRPQLDIQRDFATIDSFGQTNSNNLVGSGLFNQAFTSNGGINSNVNSGINILPNNGANNGLNFGQASGLISSLNSLSNLGQTAGLNINANSGQNLGNSGSINLGTNSGVNSNQNLILSSANSGVNSGASQGVNFSQASGLFSSLSALNNLGKSAGLTTQTNTNLGLQSGSNTNTNFNSGLNNVNGINTDFSVSNGNVGVQTSSSGSSGTFNVLDSFVTANNNLRNIRQP